MIARYDSPEVSDIWEDYNKFKTFLEVELALLKALEGKGFQRVLLIPFLRKLKLTLIEF